MRTKTCLSVVIVCCLSLYLAGCSALNKTAKSRTSPETQTCPHYLAMVQAYADALLENARDTYGNVHSPLIASTLDRKTMTVPTETPEDIKGIRGGDRANFGSNVFHDQNLYQVLYALSDITGDTHYAEQADKTLKWFFNHCQSPDTGLFAWGEHLSWGFRKDQLAGRGDGPHEFFGPWVLWDKSFSIAPEPCTKFAQGLWDHQIHNHSGDFSRHAKWIEHHTGKGQGYPRHGGFYIATWSQAYQRTKNPLFLKAIETLVNHYERTSSRNTGAIPCCTAESRETIMWPESNLSLAVDLWDAAQKVPRHLAEKMRQTAFNIDNVYLSLDHQFGPTGKGFVAGADIHDLVRYTEGPWTDTRIWATGYGKSTDAQVAILCCLRYQQVKDPRFKDLILKAAHRYLYTEPDTQITLYPGSMADAVFIMLKAYQLTGRQYYLDRADYFAQNAVAIFFDDTSPLPKASSQHDHYETITGGDDLMMALLDLWVTKNMPRKKVRLVYDHR